MRFIGCIILLIVLFASCKTKSPHLFVQPKNDTVQFTYLYSEALKNKMLGRDEIAQNQFSQCLTMKPGSSASAYQLANLEFKAGNLDKAMEYADKCLEIKPNNEWYLLLRAQIANNLHDTLTYSKIYEKLRKSNPTNYDYTYELALIYFELKEYDKSINLLYYLEDEVGLNENISFLKNNVNFALKRYDAIQLELIKLKNAFPDSLKYSDMLAEFYLTFSRPEKAIQMYKVVLAKDESNLDAMLGLSYIYGKLEQYNKGFPYLLACLKSGDIEFTRKFKITEPYRSASNANFSGDSLSRVYELLSRDKNANGIFLALYVKYLYSKKDLVNAERIALIAIEKFPDEYNCWDYYFNILIQQNRMEALTKYTQLALEYFPNHATIYFYSGYAYFQLKKYSESINYLEMALDYAIDDTDLEQRIYLTLAESYHSIGKHSLSDSFFDKYLVKDSTNAYLMNNYAYYLGQRKVRLEYALQLSRKSIEIEPFNSSFLDTYSWILTALKQYDKALNYIERAYKYGGNNNATIIEHYGDILHKKGNLVEAVGKWKEAYKLNNSELLQEKIKDASKL